MGSVVQTKTITKLCNPILHFSDLKSMTLPEFPSFDKTLLFLVGTTTTGDEGHSEESSQQAQGQNQAPTSAQEGATAGRRSDSDAAGFDQDWVRRSQEVSKC